MTDDETLYEARRTCGAVADELRVGDEVLYHGFRGVICRKGYYICGDPFVCVFFGTCMCNTTVDEVTKTGKHYKEFEELVNKLGED
jgi:hypothetical protein